GRIENPKLLALLALLHALGDLGLPMTLQDRLVKLAGALVVPRELLELLLSPRNVLDARLIGGNFVPKTLFLPFEDPGLRLEPGLRFSQAERVRRHRGRRLASCRFALLLGPGGHFLLEGGDFFLEDDNVRVLLAEPGSELPELLLQPGQSQLGLFWSDAGGAEDGHSEGITVGELAGQGGPSLHGARLAIGI